MVIEVIRSQSQLSRLKTDWNELLADSAADTIFLTWQWIASWIEVQDEVPDIFVVVARDEGGQLIALAPFYRTKYRLMGCKDISVLRVLGDSPFGAEYGNIIVRHGHVEDVGDRLTQQLAALDKEWDLIWMPNFAKWTDSYFIIKRILGHSRLLVRECHRPFSSVPLPSDPKEFLKRTSANTRQQIRRTCRRVFANENMRVVQVRSAESLQFYLNTLFDLHAMRWRTKNDPGAFERNPRQKSFYRSFTPKAMKHGWLRMLALEEAGRVVAIQYGFRYKDAYLQMQEAFDPSHISGLGNALRRFAIDLFIRESIREYDFLGGHTEHKRRWQAVERAGCDFLIAHHRPLSRLLFNSGIWPGGRFLKSAGS